MHCRLLRRLSFIRMCVSWRRNGAASGLLVYAYSPGLNNRKKPRISMSAMVCPFAVLER